MQLTEYTDNVHRMNCQHAMTALLSPNKSRETLQFSQMKAKCTKMYHKVQSYWQTTEVLYSQGRN